MTDEADFPIDIRGSGRDELGQRYFLLSVRGNQIAPINIALLRKETDFFGALNQAGANVYQSKTKTAVLKLLEQTPADDLATVLSRLGWHEKRAFVYPVRVIGDLGKPVERTVDHLNDSMLVKYRSQGTLEDWQREILPLCVGNSRLVFAVCWAFASSVAALIDEAHKGGGFQIFGKREAGKTTAAMVAGSVWGCHHDRPIGFAESWNTTTNELEVLMAAHTHVGIILDETTTFEGKFGDAVMRLTEGVQKGRMTQKRPLTFESFFLSTSNYTTRNLVEMKDAKPLNEAVISRITDIPLPNGGHGLFEHLHGRNDGGKLASDLQVLSRKFFGVAGPALLERLVAKLSTDATRTACFGEVRKSRAVYVRKFRKLASAKQLAVFERPLDRFASIYAAGCVAKRLGILPWKFKDIRAAITLCHLDSLRALPANLRIAKNPKTVEDAVSVLVTYIKKHRDSFGRTPLKSGTFDQAKGYSAKFKDKKWFYFSVPLLKKIAGNGYGALCEELKRKGLVDAGKGSIATQRPLFKNKSKGNKHFKRVVAISQNILKAVAK